MVEIPETNYYENKSNVEEKVPLIKKYNIPDYYLDFAYVEKCSNGKTLERILKILKSGQEGYYPELMRATEARLRQVNPNSRLLRNVTPVLSKNDLDKEELESLTDDLCGWLKSMEKNDKELESAKSKIIATEDESMPEIRQGKEVRETKKTNAKRIASTDYAAWDKYDPDAELIKMDAEEKLDTKEVKKRCKERTKKTVRFSNVQTRAEQTNQANREREKGNEFFKLGDYEEALHYYTNSLSCKSTAAAYTNRAITFIKLNKFEDAISDCAMALKLEPSNVKAHLRMAQSLEAQQRFDQALEYADKVIALDPNNATGQQLMAGLRKKCGLPIAKTTRFEIEDVESTSKSTKSKEQFKGVLKKWRYHEIVPIPGTSKMPPPFFEEVRAETWEEFQRKKWSVINSNMGLSFTTTIDVSSDDECDLKLDEATYKSVSKYNVSYTNRGSFSAIEDFSPRHVKVREGVRSNGKVSSRRIKKTSQLRPQCLAEIAKAKNAKENKKRLDGNTCDENVKKNETVDLTNSGDENKERIHRKAIHGEEIAPRNQTSNNNGLLKKEMVPHDPNGHGEPCKKTDSIPEPRDLLRPFNFLRVWTADGKDETYKTKAEILRNINAEMLPEVIGNKLDSDMFSEMVNCLFIHFTVPGEISNLRNILTNLPRIPRFGIIYLFLSDLDRKNLAHMVTFLDQHGASLPPELKKAYSS